MSELTEAVKGRGLKARPTTYNGIEMRSRLEAGFAQWLDQLHVRWEYEPRAFATEAGQYLPDFLLHDLVAGPIVQLRDVYVEIKPAAWFRGNEQARPTIDAQYRIILGSEPDARMIVAVAGIESTFWLLWPVGDDVLWTRIDWQLVDWDRSPRLGYGVHLTPPWAGDFWKPN